jgi:hypothetical protein
VGGSDSQGGETLYDPDFEGYHKYYPTIEVNWFLPRTERPQPGVAELTKLDTTPDHVIYRSVDRDCRPYASVFVQPVLSTQLPGGRTINLRQMPGTKLYYGM